MRNAWAMGWFFVVCGGCAPSSPAIVSLYGEVHVHQFAGGSHPGALLVARPVDARTVAGDTIVPPLFPVARIDGACTLTLPVGCTPPCAAGDPDQAPGIDGGAIAVRGGAGDPAVELDFTEPDDTYLPAAPFRAGETIFSGGELLDVSSGGGLAPPFHGQVRAPAPLELTAPATLPASGPITVAWRPGSADRIDVELVASTGAGDWGLVECIVSDEAGQVTLPPSLLAALPPPPRDLQLLVSRDDLAHAPSSVAGEGVVLHAGWEVALSGHE